MDRDELLKRIRSLLEDALGERLRGVGPYGSEARGDARSDSDIGVLALLAGPVSFGRDLKTCIHVLHPLVLELARPTDVSPVDAEAYERRERGVCAGAKREGIVGCGRTDREPTMRPSTLSRCRLHSNGESSGRTRRWRRDGPAPRL